MQKQLKLKIALASRIKIHNVNFKLIPTSYGKRHMRTSTRKRFD